MVVESSQGCPWDKLRHQNIFLLFIFLEGIIYKPLKQITKKNEGGMS